MEWLYLESLLGIVMQMHLGNALEVYTKLTKRRKMTQNALENNTFCQPEWCLIELLNNYITQ